MGEASQDKIKTTARETPRASKAANKPPDSDENVAEGGNASSSPASDDPAPPSPDRALRFLHLLYGDRPPGYLTLWMKRGDRTLWFGPGDHQKAAVGAVRLATRRDIYFGVGLRHKRLKGRRGRSDEVICIPGLWVDIDIYGEAHRAKNLPPSFDAALEIVQAFALAPTVTIDSGHGVHVWWLFNGPWYFGNETEHLAAASLSQDLQHAILAIAKERGWKIDMTHDLARVLRLPGTWNHKKTPVPVQIYECNEATRYRPEEIRQFLDELSQSRREATRTDKAPIRETPATPRPENSEIAATGQHWLRRALEKLPSSPRNTTGFEMALQLRDSGLNIDEATKVMDQYLASVPQAGDDSDYTAAEIRWSLKSAYSREPRPPAKRQEEDLPTATSSASAEATPSDEPTWGRELFTLEFPQPRSLLEGNLLPCSEYAVLFGQTGLGKTTLDFQLAVAHARRGLFLGIQTVQTRVLIVSLELTRAHVRKRLRTITGEENPADLANELAVVGADQLRSSLNLASDRDQRKVVSWVETGGFGLAIFDPLSLCYCGSELFDDLSPVLRFFKMLTARTGCVALITHHEPKTQRGRAVYEDLAALRGAAQIGDYAATLMRLKRKGKGLQLCFPKVRYARPPDPIWLERTEAGILVPTSPPADAQIATRQDEIRRSLAESGELPASALGEQLGVTPRTISNYVKGMDDVLRCGRGPATRYRLASKDGDREGTNPL